MAISFSYMNQNSEEWINRGLAYDKLIEAFNKYLEPLQKIYQTKNTLNEKLYNVQDKLVDSKWNSFINELKVKNVVFDKVSINSFISMVTDAVNRTAGMSEQNKNFFKFILNKLFTDNYTKDFMIEVFYTTSIFPNIAKQFLSVYPIDQEIKEFFKDKNLTKENINTEWVMGFIGLEGHAREYAMVDYLMNENLVEAKDFLDEQKYGTRFSLLDAFRGKKIISQLNLKNKEETELLQEYLALTCTDRSLKLDVNEFAFAAAKKSSISFPLERIIAMKSRMHMVYENYYKLYELVDEPRAKTLLFLIEYEFLPGKNVENLVPKLKARIDKIELTQGLAKSEIEQFNDFLKEEKLEAKFKEFTQRRVASDNANLTNKVKLKI